MLWTLSPSIFTPQLSFDPRLLVLPKLTPKLKQDPSATQPWSILPGISCVWDGAIKGQLVTEVNIVTKLPESRPVSAGRQKDPHPTAWKAVSLGRVSLWVCASWSHLLWLLMPFEQDVLHISPSPLCCPCFLVGSCPISYFLLQMKGRGENIQVILTYGDIVFHPNFLEMFSSPNSEMCTLLYQRMQYVKGICQSYSRLSRALEHTSPKPLSEHFYPEFHTSKALLGTMTWEIDW